MKRIQVRGGVYIPVTSGATNLYDCEDSVDTKQDLVSQTIGTTPTLYIPMHPQVSRFTLTETRVGYVDTANANDLADVVLYDNNETDAGLLQQSIIYKSGAINETPTTGVGSVTYHDPPRLVTLVDAGKLYFTTQWTTAVINADVAGEFFYLKVKGYVDSPN